MLQKRVVVCLDVRDGKTTKGVKFQNNEVVGDPVEMGERYYQQGVDELVYYDITASVEKRGVIIPLVEEVARRIFVPFCVGGGISSVQDIRALLLAGAEKVSINSQAVKNPSIISEGARRFGAQCIVLGVDAVADPALPSGYRVVINGGRTPTEHDVLVWCKRAVELGAGEIVVNSIDADGTREGYELTLTRLIAEGVGVPVVASGGGGSCEHLRDVLTAGKADAALIASMVHTGGYTVSDIKAQLASSSIPIRGFPIE